MMQNVAAGGRDQSKQAVYFAGTNKISINKGKSMRKNLPYLNQERLDFIFDHVYDIAERIEEQKMSDEKIAHLLRVLQAMQGFNYQHRSDDTRNLFGICNPIFNFEPNSEGTTIWLSLILAIKELYGFTEKKLVSVMKQVTIRK